LNYASIAVFLQKKAKKFAQLIYLLYLCTQNENTTKKLFLFNLLNSKL